MAPEIWGLQKRVFNSSRMLDDLGMIDRSDLTEVKGFSEK
jgi:hypothetical protein